MFVTYFLRLYTLDDILGCWLTTAILFTSHESNTDLIHFLFDLVSKIVTFSMSTFRLFSPYEEVFPS